MYLSNYFFPNIGTKVFYDKKLSLNFLFIYLENLQYYFSVLWFEKTFSFLVQNYVYLMSFNYFSFTWRHQFFLFWRGFVRPFKARIKLIGLRYRILSVKKTTLAIWLNIGLSHFFKLEFNNTYFFMTRALKKGKYALQFFNIDLIGLGQFLFLLRRFRGPNVFTGNGIKILKEKFLLKKRKKSK